MKLLEKYLEKRVEEILQLLKKPRQSYRVSTYHDLRVEIKQLKALCKLTEDSIKKFSYKKLYSLYDEVFSQAGKVRELQVKTNMLKKNSNNTFLKTYIQDLVKLTGEERNKYFSLLDKKLLQELKKNYKDIESKLKRVSKKDALVFLDKKEDKIDQLLLKTLPPSKVHELRKRLKEHLYISESIESKNPTGPDPKLEEFTDLLGDWHDTQVLIDHLDESIDDFHGSAREQKQLQRVKNKFSTENENLLKKINDAKSTVKL